MIAAAALGFSLFVNACLDGSLHGKPMKICQEHPIRHYLTAEQCTAAVKGGTVTDWITMMHVVGIDVEVKTYRCGPTEADGDDI